LVEEKGLRTIAEAIKEFPRVKLLMVGEGNYRGSLEKMINSAKIKNIEFKDYLSKEDLDMVIKNAICVVVPSLYYDNSPMVIYESFAMGKPVIGANIGGIPELIDNNVNGFLFKSEDVNDLVKKIRHLLDNKDKLRETGKNARKKAVENYNPDVHYDRILKVYQDLVKPR
jgi:glycosyltransferase involved in cell wall biosynthesis